MSMFAGEGTFQYGNILLSGVQAVQIEEKQWVGQMLSLSSHTKITITDDPIIPLYPCSVVMHDYTENFHLPVMYLCRALLLIPQA